MSIFYMYKRNIVCSEYAHVCRANLKIVFAEINLSTLTCTDNVIYCGLFWTPWKYRYDVNV